MELLCIFHIGHIPYMMIDSSYTAVHSLKKTCSLLSGGGGCILLEYRNGSEVESVCICVCMCMNINVCRPCFVPTGRLSFVQLVQALPHCKKNPVLF